MGKIKIEYYVLFFLVIGFLAFCYFSNFCSIERDVQKIETILQEEGAENVLKLTPNDEEKPISVYTNEKVEKTENVTDQNDPGIKHFGLNVYYFQQTGNNFGQKLVLFLKRHTDLEVSAIAGEVIRKNRGSLDRYDLDYGETMGYFVTFREKK